MNRYIILLSILLQVKLAYSQSNYYTRSILPNETFNREEINCLTIEKSGILLVGSNSGVIAYDGNTFRNIAKKNKNEPNPTRCNHFFKNNNGIELRDLYNTFKISNNQIAFIAKNNRDFLIDFQKSIETNIKKIISPQLLDNIVFEIGREQICLSINKNEAYFYVNDSLYYVVNNKIKNLGCTPPYDNYFSIGNSAFYITNDGIIEYKSGKRNISKLSFQDTLTNERFSSRLENIKVYYYEGTYYFSGKFGLYHLVAKNNNFIKIKKIIEKEQLANYNINCIALSKDKKTIYLGTNNDGLIQFSQKQFSYAQFQSSNKNYNYVNELIVIGDELIAGKTWNPKLVKYKLDGSGYSFIPNKKQNEYFRSSKNRFYYYNGLAKEMVIFDSVLRPIKKIKKRIALGNSFCEDSKGNIYFIDATGVFRIDEKQKLECVFYITQPENIQIPNAGYFRDDTLWSTNLDSGLKYYDLKKKTMGYYSEFTTLSPRYVIGEPNGKGVFVCTYGYGIWYVCGKQATRVLSGNNNIFDFCHSLTFDIYNRVWLPTNDGLYVIAYETLLKSLIKKDINYFWHFTTKDNLISNEFNGGYKNSLFYDIKRNYLYLATTKGVVGIFTGLANPTHDSYPPMFLNIRKDNKEIFWTNELQDFEQISGDIIIPGNHKYQITSPEYRLSPLNKEWQTAENNQFIISRPKPGKYEVQVRYRNGFGDNNYVTNSYPLTILPLWYETLLFKLLFIIVNLVLIMIISLILTSRLRKRKKILQDLVDQKTLALLEEMREVQTLSLQNEMFIRMLTHDIKVPLQSTSTTANFLSKNLGIMQANELKFYLQEIGKSSYKISQYIHHFLTWIKLRKNSTLTNEATDVCKLIDQIIDFAKETNIVGNNQIVKQYSNSEILINTNSHVLSIVISNLLENACKYTTNGIIKVGIQVHNSKLIININDNGKGMNKEVLENLLSKNSLEVSDYQHSYKMGYAFIREFINLIHGELNIHSIEGTGTTVILTISND
jgi:signal transduction histidine kinase